MVYFTRKPLVYVSRMTTPKCIDIPLAKDLGSVAFFVDELPSECDDLIDVLRSELAPFKVWRQCAVR